jgi:hypothetical protein
LNAAPSEIHDRPPHDALDTGHMVGWGCSSLAHDGSEGTARERLELVVSERRPVPLGRGLGHDLIGVALEDRLVDNGLAKGRLEPGHADFNAGWLFERDGLWDGCLKGAVRSDKKQQCSEDNRAHADTHDDVNGIVAV